jgi:hypothetical protein
VSGLAPRSRTIIRRRIVARSDDAPESTVAAVVMVRFPRGRWGYVAARFDLHLFPAQRRLAIPGGKSHTEDAA